MENDTGDEPRRGFTRTAPDHVTDDIAELLAGYSLNALSDEETAFIERYLPDRPQWRLELSGYRRVADALPYAGEPQQVPVRARAAILSRIDALAIESQERELANNRRSGPLRSHLRRWRSHVPRVAWVAAVPTTTIAIIFIMMSIVMQDRIIDQQEELAAFQQEQVQANDVLLADDSHQQVVELIRSNTAPLARGRLFIDRTNNTAMLVVRDMPPPGDDRVYMVWMLIGSNPDEYAQLGPLTLDEFGRGQKILDPPDDFDRYPTVRITLEDSDDIGAPRGPDVMTGGIGRLDIP